jgi:hypothetical protein
MPWVQPHLTDCRQYDRPSQAAPKEEAVEGSRLRSGSRQQSAATLIASRFPKAQRVAPE